MTRLVLVLISVAVTLAGCSIEAPTRPNSFTPLTSITIEDTPASVAKGTSVKLKVIGHYSGLFKKDITDQVAFSSDMPAIADFSNPSAPSWVTGVSAGTALLKASLGSISGQFSLTVTNATISSVSITPASQSLPQGSTYQFQLNGTFSDNTTQDLTFDGQWVSSNPAVATVSNTVPAKGVIHALSLGQADISASFGGLIAVSKLTVTEPVLLSISVTPSKVSLLSISTAGFKAQGTYSDGSTVDITEKVTWSSSDTAVAKMAGATVTTLTQGSSVITASLSGKNGSSELKVTGGKLISIAVQPTSLTLVKGTATRVSAIGSFSNSTTRDISSSVVWSSDITEKVTVSAPGGSLAWVTAGNVTSAQSPPKVTATCGAVSGSLEVAVTDPSLTSGGLTVAPSTSTIVSATSCRFIVNGTFSSNPNLQSLTYSAGWSSGTPGTATAYNEGIGKGRVRGVAASGNPVTITASYANQTATGSVTVVSKNLKNLTITGLPAASVLAGNQVALVVTANFTDGSSQDVTEDAVWSVDNSNIAVLADSINLPGQIIAVDSGTASVTATFGGQSQTAKISVP